MGLNHTPGFTQISATDAAHESMLQVAQALAMTGVDLVLDADLLRAHSGSSGGRRGRSRALGRCRLWATEGVALPQAVQARAAEARGQSFKTGVASNAFKPFPHEPRHEQQGGGGIQPPPTEQQVCDEAGQQCER